MNVITVACSLIMFMFTVVQSQKTGDGGAAFGVLGKIYAQCENESEMFRCFKLQAIRLAGRALKVQNIRLIDGLSVVKKHDLTDNRAYSDIILSETQLSQLSDSKVNEVLFNRASKFIETHELQINIPRLLTFGQQQTARLLEEGRKKHHKNKYMGPFLAAVALKAGILKMAYHSIAIVAGKALIIGKIALIISAIIGLKKLVSPEGHEKTTYEIVKHPHVQQSHTYSSSHNEYEGGHEGAGQYHRSLADSDMLMQERAYSAHVPRD